MPKLKETAAEKLNKTIRGNLKYLQIYYGYSAEQMALIMGITAPTFSRRMASPEEFKIEELQRAAEKCRIPVIQILTPVQDR